VVGAGADLPNRSAELPHGRRLSDDAVRVGTSKRKRRVFSGIEPRRATAAETDELPAYLDDIAGFQMGLGCFRSVEQDRSAPLVPKRKDAVVYMERELVA
jgi:hypothetical protein